ncbi:MAG TPA: PAS domain-containing protein [Candidatus Sulfotelmatobacter sp.]|nr:PAS domain-containing protein [Candidatus Sulfotelmatobacter sp.]
MALIGIVVIKAVLSFAVKPGSFTFSYSGVSYFLLLALAASFAIRNAMQNTLGSRPFWVFLAIGYGLWALDEWIYLYYELGLHLEVPDSSIADPILFLHIVPLMAALAAFPHQNLSDQRPYRAVLDALLLLFFWSFLYGYIVFPSQYLARPTNYTLRFDILYGFENLALVSAAGILTLRGRAPWKSIYFHLFGASALYALSSAVANFAIDSGGYVNGKLYGLGLTASVCWFVWIPLRARRVSRLELEGIQSSDESRASSWAMLVVVLISIPIVWELYHRDETTGTRTFRLLVAILAIVCIACAAYIREHLVRSELASRLGFTNHRLHLAMKSGKIVAWDWDIKSGRDSWFGDLQTQFGIPSDSFVGRVEDFHRRIHPEDRERVAKAVKEAMQNRKAYAAEFRILWPNGTVRWISAEGEFYYAVNGEPERMLGISIDITERKRAVETLRESELRLRLAAQAGKMYAYEWDVATDAVERSSDDMNNFGLTGDPTSLTRQQILAMAHPDDRAKLDAAVANLTPGNPTSRVTYRRLLPSGAVIWLEKSARAFFDGHGKMLRMIGIVADVTERKLSEEALSQVSRKLIEAQESERARIGRDLHDDIGQRLSLLAIQLQQMRQALPDSAVEIGSHMDELWNQTSEISKDVQALSHELHSSKLEYLGIVAAMRGFCREFGEKQRMEIEFKSHDLPSQLPSQEVSLSLFRVLQESLHNASKHSGVRHVEVELGGRIGEIHLTVSDAGAGFDPQAGRQGRGLGLTSMRERMKLINGELSVQSKPKSGTTVRARVPLGPDLNPERAVG